MNSVCTFCNQLHSASKALFHWTGRKRVHGQHRDFLLPWLPPGCCPVPRDLHEDKCLGGPMKASPWSLSTSPGTAMEWEWIPHHLCNSRPETTPQAGQGRGVGVGATFSCMSLALRGFSSLSSPSSWIHSLIYHKRLQNTGRIIGFEQLLFILSYKKFPKARSW